MLKFTLNANKSFSAKIAALCFLSFSLIGCSTLDEAELALLPAELQEFTPKFTPEVIWDVDLGSGVDEHFSEISPMIAYNKVYTANRIGDVVALDIETGDELWSTDISDPDNKRGFFDDRISALVNGGPVAGVDKVFVGTENGKLFALNAETGVIEWQASIKGEIIASPAVDSGVVVVNSASGLMKAFNAINGEELWEIEQEVPPLTLRGVSAPAMAPGGVIVGTATGTLNVYLIDGGQQGWMVTIGEPTGSTELDRVIDVDSAPLIYGDKVYSISSRGNLTAVELMSGRILWQREYSSSNNLAISGSNLLLTDMKGHVYAVDLFNGLERWSQLALSNRNVTGPAVVGNYVVVGDFEGYLHWLDTETGEIVARHQISSGLFDSGIYSTPTVDNNIIYIQSRDGDIEAIKTPEIVPID